MVAPVYGRPPVDREGQPASERGTAPNGRRRGGELAAGAVDLAAAGVAHRDRDAVGLEPAHELALVLGRDAVHFDPGVGLSGIRLTCTSLPRSRLPSRSARHAWSLTSRMRAYSMDTRRSVRRA